MTLSSVHKAPRQGCDLHLTKVTAVLGSVRRSARHLTGLRPLTKQAEKKQSTQNVQGNPRHMHGNAWAVAVLSDGWHGSGRLGVYAARKEGHGVHARSIDSDALARVVVAPTASRVGVWCAWPAGSCDCRLVLTGCMACVVN